MTREIEGRMFLKFAKTGYLYNGLID